MENFWNLFLDGVGSELFFSVILKTIIQKS